MAEELDPEVVYAAWQETDLAVYQVLSWAEDPFAAEEDPERPYLDPIGSSDLRHDFAVFVRNGYIYERVRGRTPQDWWLEFKKSPVYQEYFPSEGGSGD